MYKYIYRPISLLPSASKFLEKAVPVYNQLTACLERIDILNKRQYGFRRGKSTKLALTHFINECVNALEASVNVTVLLC